MTQTSARSPFLALFTSVWAIGSMVWFGTFLARTVLAFDLFVTGTTVLKSTQTAAVQVHTVWQYTLLGGWSGWSFAVALLCGIGAAILSRRLWKNNGWIVMVALLMLVTLPGQVWMIMADIDMWRLFDPGTGLALASPEEVIAVFLNRATDVVWSVVNGFTLLTAVTIALLLVWQPLRRPQPLTNVNETE